MDDFIRVFLRALRDERGYSPNTIAEYERDLRQLTIQVGNRLEDYTPNRLQAYLDSLKSHYSNNSQVRKNTSLRTFFKYLKGQGIVEVNPTLGLDYPSLDHWQEPGRDKPQVEDLRLKAIIDLLADGGLDASQIAGLDMGDVGDEKLVVRGRRDRVRLIPIPDSLGDYLNTLPKRRRGPVFVTKLGHRLTRGNVRMTIGQHGLNPRQIGRSFRQKLRNFKLIKTPLSLEE